MRWFASFTVTNHTGRWKEWHPFPVSSWVVGVVPVRHAGLPTNPADGEIVVDVQLLEPADAITYFAGFDNSGQDWLLALALDLGLLDQ